MSTMSDISALLDEIKSCGNTLISIYDELHNLIDNKEPDEEKPKTKTRKKRTKTEEAPETVLEEQPPEEPPKPLTFEEIQTAFGMKSRDGHTAEVKALITNVHLIMIKLLGLLPAWLKEKVSQLFLM